MSPVSPPEMMKKDDMSYTEMMITYPQERGRGMLTGKLDEGETGNSFT